MDEWLPLDDARARLGLHPDTLRRQIRKGQREGRKDNHGRWLVLVRADPDLPGRIDPGAPGRRDPDHARAHPDTSGQLREQVARLEERLAATEDIKAELRRQVQELRERLAREDERREAAEARQAERDRQMDELLRRLGDLRPERRPWPGLRAWWRRVIEGEG
jgi:hypothetical protein